MQTLKVYTDSSEERTASFGTKHYSQDTYITPAMAATFVGSLRWERQRTLRPRWVDQLADAIRDGDLTFLTIAFAEYPDGRRELIDGQHRLQAVITTGVTLPATVIVYPVTGQEETARLYMKFDRPLVRPVAAGLRAAGLFEMTDLSERFVRRMSAGAWIIVNGFRSGADKGGSLPQRTEAALAWLPEMEAFHPAVDGCPKKMNDALLRGPVAAVALVTFRYQSEKAAPFWSRVASQEMLHAGDPRLTLGRFLLEKLEKDVPGGRADYARYVSLAWNAWYEGRELRILKIADPTAAIAIRGTPWRGDGRRG
jgi:hypothetical protein